MTIDPKLIGIGAAILAVVLIVFMPVNKRRVNQTIVALLIAILIFVAAFSLLEFSLALPVAAGLSLIVIVARLALGGLRSFIYHNLTRYTRRDFWQRRVGQAIIGSNRRRRRD
jgi:lipopolysaccharide export LptBFGC system permease protein LptF